jgi:hypothetical protein
MFKENGWVLVNISLVADFQDDNVTTVDVLMTEVVALDVASAWYKGASCGRCKVLEHRVIRQTCLIAVPAFARLSVLPAQLHLEFLLSQSAQDQFLLALHTRAWLVL